MESIDVWRVSIVVILSAAALAWGVYEDRKKTRAASWWQKLDAAERERRATLPERPPSFLARLFERKKPDASE